MTALARAQASFAAIFECPGDTRALALVRILVGPIVVYHLWPFLEAMRHGSYYADYFYAPWAAWLVPPPRSVYFAMLTACVLSALLMSVGYKTRWTSRYTAFFVTYNFFSSETFFRHNRNFLILILIMLALVPSGRVFSWDARHASATEPLETRAPLWPMYLMRFEVVCVYCASSISKLLNPDWRSGTVLLARSRWYEPTLRASPLPDVVVDLVTDPTFHSLFAKFAIATEFAIAILLVSRRFRYAGAFLAISFHAIIEVALSVQIFSYLAVGGLLIWTTPKLRERTISFDPTSIRAVGWLKRLDWLARFRFEEREQGGLQLQDRDGRVYQGAPALRRALMLCPLTFAFAAPLVLFDTLRSPAPETSPARPAP